MSAIIHRHQSQGNVSNRKVIGVEKSPLLGQSQSETKVEDTKLQEIAKNPPAVAPASVPSDQEKTRAELSALEKSRKLAQKAKEDIKKAESMVEAYTSGDLDKIAKAHGMATADYVRWVNAKMLGTPTDKIPSPKERVEQNAKNWQQVQEERTTRLEQKAAAADKYSYMNKNILPHVIKEPEKYEFIVDRGVDGVCSDVYDFMNQHFVSTQEELDPVELLNSLEEEYKKEWQDEEKIREEKRKKFKSLANTTQQLEKPEENASVSANSEGLSAKTIGPAKSVSHPNKTSEDVLAETLANEDALAQNAPSNLVAGPSRGSAPAPNSRKVSTSSNFQTGGTTPKGSQFSREARLAAMAKTREEK